MAKIDNKLTVTLSELPEMVSHTVRAGLVPMVVSSPGLGKSSVGQQVAKEFNLKFIDVRLAQCDPVDLNGFPKVDGNKATYLPMDTFPIEGDSLPLKKAEVKDPKGNVVEPAEYYDGWMIMFDEITSAPKSIQAAAYKIILDRMVGQHNIHPRVAMMAAGNLQTDGAVVMPMSTALQSRMIHFEARVDINSWMDWAGKAGIDGRVAAYLKYKPQMLHQFDADHSDKTFPCPRTWEFLSRLIKGVADVKNMLPIMAGTVGEGAAREFRSFTEIASKLPSLEEMINNPKGVPIPTEPSLKYAMAGVVMQYFNQQNGNALAEMVNRMPVEFQMLTFKHVCQADPSVLTLPVMNQWLINNAIDLG